KSDKSKTKDCGLLAGVVLLCSQPALQAHARDAAAIVAAPGFLAFGTIYDLRFTIYVSEIRSRPASLVALGREDSLFPVQRDFQRRRHLGPANSRSDGCGFPR